VPLAFPLRELPRCFDRRIVVHGDDIGLSQAVRPDLGRPLTARSESPHSRSVPMADLPSPICARATAMERGQCRDANPHSD
jgi:hypothetical protein